MYNQLTLRERRKIMDEIEHLQALLDVDSLVGELLYRQDMIESHVINGTKSDSYIIAEIKMAGAKEAQLLRLLDKYDIRKEVIHHES